MTDIPNILTDDDPFVVQQRQEVKAILEGVIKRARYSFSTIEAEAQILTDVVIGALQTGYEKGLMDGKESCQPESE